jgi:hypothetical protein
MPVCPSIHPLVRLPVCLVSACDCVPVCPSVQTRLRSRNAHLIIRPDQPTDYWQRNLLYSDDKAQV